MKSRIREEMRNKRKHVNRRGIQSRMIFERAMQLFEVDKHVLIFVPMEDEIDTRDFFLACPNISVPKCISRQSMIAVSYGGEMEKSKFGVMEPVSNQEELGIEVAIVPGLAFDLAGNRIGYGAGYYDKYLSEHPNILKIGVCYDFQLIDSIYPEPFDVPMDYVVTPTRIIMRELCES